jgi:hypothetical protein
MKRSQASLLKCIFFNLSEFPKESEGNDNKDEDICEADSKRELFIEYIIENKVTCEIKYGDSIVSDALYPKNRNKYLGLIKHSLPDEGIIGKLAV